MTQKLLVKLDELSKMLQMKNNDSYCYFQDIRNSIINKNDIRDILMSLTRCYAITQYADFNKMEEALLSEIIDLGMEELSQLK